MIKSDRYQTYSSNKEGEKSEADKANRNEGAEEEEEEAQWTKIERKTGSPSLNPEGEETNRVCRERRESQGQLG